jgi:hypothetical protein
MSEESIMLDQVKHRLHRLESFEQSAIEVHEKLSDYCVVNPANGVKVFNPNKTIDELLEALFDCGYFTSVRFGHSDAEV